MGAFVILSIIGLPIAIYVRGLVISFTWLWFIAPITGWRSINIAEGVGLSIFCAIISNATTTQTPKIPKEEKDKAYYYKQTLKAYGKILLNLILLVVAWLWYTFAIH